MRNKACSWLNHMSLDFESSPETSDVSDFLLTVSYLYPPYKHKKTLPIQERIHTRYHPSSPIYRFTQAHSLTLLTPDTRRTPKQLPFLTMKAFTSRFLSTMATIMYSSFSSFCNNVFIITKSNSQCKSFIYILPVV